MKIEQKIEKLGYRIPKAPKPLGSYVPAVRIGNLLFVGGKIPLVEGQLRYKGKVGKDLGIEEGYEAAKICALNLLSVVKDELGDLDKVQRIIKVTGYINSSSGFTEQPKVLNGASELLLEVFGDKGKHARAAIGVSELALDAPLEVEMIVGVKD